MPRIKKFNPALIQVGKTIWVRNFGFESSWRKEGSAHKEFHKGTIIEVGSNGSYWQFVVEFDNLSTYSKVGLNRWCCSYPLMKETDFRF